MKLAIILSVVILAMVYFIIRSIQVNFAFEKKDNKERDIFDFDFHDMSEDCFIYIFKWGDIEIKNNINSQFDKHCSLDKLNRHLKIIAEKRPILFKEMYYTLDNMIRHIKYIYEEDNNNFVAEVNKHIKELLQPIINKISEEDKLAEEELQRERQKIIDKEKEDYYLKFNACKELWLDKMELGSSGEDEVINENRYNLSKNTNKTFSAMESYYNDKLNLYAKISKSANEKINLLNKLKNEIRQNYADGICTYETMTKYEKLINKEIIYVYDKDKIKTANDKLDEMLNNLETRIEGR